MFLQTSQVSIEKVLLNGWNAFSSSIFLLAFNIFSDFVSSSYIPMKQFENSTKAVVTFEVEEFVPCIPKHTQPFTIYNNHLYVYPKHLKYDSQKSFAKVSSCVHYLDSDSRPNWIWIKSGCLIVSLSYLHEASKKLKPLCFF